MKNKFFTNKNSNNKKIQEKEVAQGYASICREMEASHIFKSFEWASSIMANASICRVDHPGSIPGSSTATKNN